jgi:hypothetical protein
LDPLPSGTIPLLRQALERRKTGFLLVGSSEIGEHWAAELVTAVLPLTDFAGPAARIKPRQRSTPAKDWNVPDALKALPFLPSIESAYAQGYRRMVINPGYTDGELLMEYGDEVLFIAGSYGCSVDDVFLAAMRYRGLDKAQEALKNLVAILSVTSLKTPRLAREGSACGGPAVRTLGRKAGHAGRRKEGDYAHKMGDGVASPSHQGCFGGSCKVSLQG